MSPPSSACWRPRRHRQGSQIAAQEAKRVSAADVWARRGPGLPVHIAACGSATRTARRRNRCRSGKPPAADPVSTIIFNYFNFIYDFARKRHLYLHPRTAISLQADLNSTAAASIAASAPTATPRPTRRAGVPRGKCRRQSACWRRVVVIIVGAGRAGTIREVYRPPKGPRRHGAYSVRQPFPHNATSGPVSGVSARPKVRIPRQSFPSVEILLLVGDHLPTQIKRISANHEV
jgi:hypothetical protein